MIISININKFLRYDPITGNLHWLVNCGRNGGRGKIGDIAGGLNSSGYVVE